MDRYLLIKNAQIFNGIDDKITQANVLVKNNHIFKISGVAIDCSAIPTEQIEEIDAQHKYLMPGLIDAHWHAFLSCNTLQDLLMSETSYLHHIAGKEAKATLLRGFTTIRDAGGPVYGLKNAIDRGILEGPRIYPSGAMISQTSGHGDYRPIYDTSHVGCGCALAHTQQAGNSWIVDGVDAVTTATRENLKQGSSQIKLLVGGGAASLYDPLDVSEFFEEEIHAAVKAASDWGTYVMVHVYNPKGIQRAIRAGVKSIEHGHLIDEDSMKLLVDSDVWLSMQAFTVEDNTYPTPQQQAKHIQICAGTDNTYELAIKHNAKLAWGTDLLFNPKNLKNQNKGILKLKRWFSDFDILKMVTSGNAQLLALSGARNPYPDKLGVIEEGAFADMLLVNANPLADVSVLGDPDNNFSLIVKDGVVHKNTL